MVDFLVIGHRTSACLDCMFELIKDSKASIGYESVTKFNNSESGSACFWYTSLKKGVCFIDLVDFNSEKYSTIGMTGIINVGQLNDIPDYDGVMGVPVTFLWIWNPDQFEVLGKTGGGYRYKDYVLRKIIENEGLWERIFIRRK